MLMFSDDIPAVVKCDSVSLWACRKRRRRNSPCMRGGTNDRGEKRNVLIVIVLLPIRGDLKIASRCAAIRRGASMS